mmetsp:Transcript_1852/g.2811  ORF Transcript_1852/g.2811 Transcript_1852/m.2811 type:complete len:356 (+) Transcript_1852:128-1195(+)
MGFPHTQQSVIVAKARDNCVTATRARSVVATLPNGLCHANKLWDCLLRDAMVLEMLLDFLEKVYGDRVNKSYRDYFRDQGSRDCFPPGPSPGSDFFTIIRVARTARVNVVSRAHGPHTLVSQVLDARCSGAAFAVHLLFRHVVYSRQNEPTLVDRVLARKCLHEIAVVNDANKGLSECVHALLERCVADFGGVERHNPHNAARRAGVDVGICDAFTAQVVFDRCEVVRRESGVKSTHGATTDKQWTPWPWVRTSHGFGVTLTQRIVHGLPQLCTVPSPVARPNPHGFYASVEILCLSCGHAWLQNLLNLSQHCDLRIHCEIRTNSDVDTIKGGVATRNSRALSLHYDRMSCMVPV